jgi:hypothetical protein
VLHRAGRVLEVQDQVLGGVLVREGNALCEGRDLDDDRFLDGLSGDLDPREGLRLDVDLLLDLREELGRQVDRDEDDLRVGAVLRLRQEVGRDEDGVGRLVRDDLGSDHT